MKRFSRTVVQFSDDPTFSDVETEETTTLRARVAELERSYQNAVLWADKHLAEVERLKATPCTHPCEDCKKDRDRLRGRVAKLTRLLRVSTDLMQVAGPKDETVLSQVQCNRWFLAGGEGAE